VITTLMGPSSVNANAMMMRTTVAAIVAALTCQLLSGTCPRRVVGVGNVVFDVTDRHEADEFRAVLMNNMAEGPYALDASGSLIYNTGRFSPGFANGNADRAEEAMREYVESAGASPDRRPFARVSRTNQLTR
jgi:hypothetical protein